MYRDATKCLVGSTRRDRHLKTVHPKLCYGDTVMMSSRSSRKTTTTTAPTPTQIRSESQTMTRSRTRPLSFGDILAAADDPMVVDQQPPTRSTRSTRGAGRTNSESSSRADEDSSTDVAHALLSLQQPQQPPPRRRRAAGAAPSSDIAPSVLELQQAKTPRAIQGLQTWYLRFNELVEYKETFGDCNVPQKYPPNSQLGIVRKTVSSVIAETHVMNFSSLVDSGSTNNEWRKSSLKTASGPA